jgi:hypothetical protein
VAVTHAQGGSAVRPLAPHSAGVVHGSAGAGVPPGQKNPRAHSEALLVVEPAAQPKPRGATHAPLQEGEVSPSAAPKKPGAQA